MMIIWTSQNRFSSDSKTQTEGQCGLVVLLYIVDRILRINPH
jgi:hypothetical protein